MEIITIDGNEFAIFKSSGSYGCATFRVLNIQANLDRFAAKLAKANKPMKTYAQQFEAARRAQMKTTVGPVERARIMAEHMAAGTYSEGVEDGSD